MSYQPPEGELATYLLDLLAAPEHPSADPRPSPTWSGKKLDGRATFDVLVDFGYLSYIHGTRPNQGGWDTAKFKYDGRSLLCLDDSRTVRIDEYPDYKSKRREARLEDPKKRSRHNLIRAFRAQVEDDPILRSIRFPGLEADDLIALLFCTQNIRRVIGVDKDFFQVPNLRHVMEDHQGNHTGYRVLKQPKYSRTITEASTSWEVVLHQALFGDKSDSIPRLLSSRPSEAKVTTNEILSGNTPLAEAKLAHQRFGSDFIMNLRLLLLPHISLSKKAPEYQHDNNVLLLDITTEQYWAPENWADAAEVVLEAIQAREVRLF